MQPPYLIHSNAHLSPDGRGGNHNHRHLLFSSSSAAGSSASPPKKKRGRPRKYSTPEQAFGPRKVTASSPSAKDRKERSATLLQQLPERGVVGNSDSGDGKRGYLSKMSMTHSSSLGNSGHGFVPHVIAVAAGDDVAQRLMEFTQQSKREICVLSASGSVSTASLRQPATTGGTITYGGWFEIITLSGSYMKTHFGGRTGGLSVCLSSPDGPLIGGGVGGPLMAACPFQVIIGSFIFNMKKDFSDAVTNESPNKSPTPTPPWMQATSWFIPGHM